MNPAVGSTDFVGFKSPREDTELGFVYPVFRTPAWKFVAQTVDAVMPLDGDKVTRHNDGTIKVVTFCKEYDPSNVHYEAFWDSKVLWLAERFQLRNMSLVQLQEMEQNLFSATERDRNLARHYWLMYVLGSPS